MIIGQDWLVSVELLVFVFLAICPSKLWLKRGGRDRLADWLPIVPLIFRAANLFFVSRPDETQQHVVLFLIRQLLTNGAGKNPDHFIIKMSPSLGGCRTLNCSNIIMLLEISPVGGPGFHIYQLALNICSDVRVALDFGRDWGGRALAEYSSR